MRLYKTKFIDDEQPQGRNECATWCGTQSDAGKDRKRLKSEGMRNIETQEVEVPTNKESLLAFLNQWAAVL